MGIDGIIEPIYFLITSIGFVILSFIQYKKTGKTLETIYLSILAVFFIVYSYVLIQSPASHYGVSNTTDNEASIIMILTSLIGVLVFHYWLQDSSW